MLEEVRVDLALVEGRVGLDVVLVLLDLDLEAGFLGQIVLNVVENLGASAETAASAMEDLKRDMVFLRSGRALPGNGVGAPEVGNGRKPGVRCEGLFPGWLPLSGDRPAG